MELYDKVSYKASRDLTLAYSTSFSKSIGLFDKAIQPHIFAIYGLVRIADEIVDTYVGSDKQALLNSLETETYEAIKRGYSANPIVHAFARTAKQYGIGKTLLRPFFESMAMDIDPPEYTQKLYEKYIDGSAEVVGLMSLQVFVGEDKKAYEKLEKGARALGAAYQKINFLRDMAADYKVLHRIYFPGVTYESFGDKDKNKIVKDIQSDLMAAKKSLAKLPTTSRHAVELSLVYYEALLEKLKRTPAATIKKRRVRINDAQKAVLFAQTSIKRRFDRA